MVVFPGGHLFLLRLTLPAGGDEFSLVRGDHACRRRLFPGWLGVAALQAGRSEGLKLEKTALKDRLELIDSAETTLFDCGNLGRVAWTGVVGSLFDGFDRCKRPRADIK